MRRYELRVTLHFLYDKYSTSFQDFSDFSFLSEKYVVRIWSNGVYFFFFGIEYFVSGDFFSSAMDRLSIRAE